MDGDIKNTSLLLKNCNILSPENGSIIRNSDILIRNDIIEEVGLELSSKYTECNTLDIEGKWVLPGNVCSHHHIYSTFARGLTVDIAPSPDFLSILKNMWWRLDRHIDEEILFYSGLTAALDSIKHGVTSVIDHHASPSFIKGSLNTLRNTFERIGLRGILCYETTDRHGEKDAYLGIEENVDFSDSLGMSGSPLIQSAIGAHAPFTLSNRTLEGLKDALQHTGKGLHIHVAEDVYDKEHSVATHCSGIMKRLDSFDLVNEKGIFVHGVHLTEEDIKILNDKDAFFAHNVRSNLNNGVGYASHISAIRHPVLGTDGIGSNMIEEMRAAYFVHQAHKGNESPGFFVNALNRGNRILEKYFHRKFGKVEKGYVADLTIWDYNSPTPVNSLNYAGHLLFGYSSVDVDTVIINGQIVLKNHNFVFNTDEIYNDSSKQAERLWKKMSEE